MNEKIDLGKIGLGENSQPSKSLLTTINLGYNIEKPPESKIKKVVINIPEKREEKPKKIPLKEPVTIKKPIPPQIDYKEWIDLVTTFNTGFEHNDKPVIEPPKPEINCHPIKGEDSIIESVDTGFGCDNQIVIDCPKPKYKTHLCKENYLGEFKTESEKTLARNNLGVYSKEEIDKIVGQIVENNNNNFVTRKEVQNMIANLDFVDSTLKSYADYQIPNNLFKL